MIAIDVVIVVVVVVVAVVVAVVVVVVAVVVVVVVAVVVVVSAFPWVAVAEQTIRQESLVRPDQVSVPPSHFRPHSFERRRPTWRPKKAVETRRRELRHR